MTTVVILIPGTVRSNEQRLEFIELLKKFEPLVESKRVEVLSSSESAYAKCIAMHFNVEVSICDELLGEGDVGDICEAVDDYIDPAIGVVFVVADGDIACIAKNLADSLSKKVNKNKLPELASDVARVYMMM